MSRLGPSVDGSLSTLLVVGAGVVALSFVSLSGTQPVDSPGAPIAQQPGQSTNSNNPGSKVTNPQGKGGGNKSGPVAGGNVGPGVTPAQAQACAAGRNGGATDRGVSATSIKLGATVVSSGIGASFLGPVRIGINAVKDKVNRAGGICGRRLDVTLVDDGWDAQRGYGYIRNLVEGENMFALAVNPSSEGLRIASNAGYFAKTKTPVIGTDGMLNSQYADPWVWPVAASTVSTMHIMAADAYNRLRARHFSIIFDSQYHFGVEGAFAFNSAVKRLTGQNIPGYFDPGSSSSCNGRFCAISAGRSSYATENKTFNDACFVAPAGINCDFVALLLEPNEALTFLRAGFSGGFGAGVGLAQTLFTRSFAANCGSVCNGALTWTGYNPPIEAMATLPAVSTYVNDVHLVDPSADIYNQFLEGGYSGMELVVDALTKAGPNLTREGIKTVLDSLTYNNGLSTPLTWRPGNHFANVAMQPFAIQYQNGFNGFRAAGTGWVKDPWVGQDIPKSGG